MKTQFKGLILLLALTVYVNSSFGGTNPPKCLECGTGADGRFEAYSDTVLPGGTYNFSSFYIDAGATVTVTGTQPLIIYSSGNVEIYGTLNAGGQNGTDGVTSTSAGIGGLGVAGGSNGGNGSYDSGTGPLNGDSGNGLGGGGFGNDWSAGGGGGHNGAGQIGPAYTGYVGTATGGVSYGVEKLYPFTAGSGGGGGSGGFGCGSGGGGGGGGVIVIHSCGYIYVSGLLSVNGGNGGSDGTGNCGGGGGGSGGAVILISPAIYNYGAISAIGGTGGGSTNTAVGGNGASGRIRMDYNFLDNSGLIDPAIGYSVNILAVSVDSISNVSCNGQTDGAIYTTPSSIANVGQPPSITYLWSNNQTTDDITSLSDGTYTLSVIADNNCYASISKIVYEPTPTILTTYNIVDVSCNGAADGAINITAEGGVAPGTKLTTNLTSNNGSNGNMFDFNVLQQTELTGFEVNISSHGTVEVYYKSGTFVGSELDSAAWTSLGTYSVTSAGADVATDLILNAPLLLAPGSYALALYSVNGNWNYIDGNLQGNLWASDTYFQIYEGIAKTGGGAFSNQIAGPRNFSGSFIYTAQLDIDTYNWSNGGSTENISGLSGGNYNLTITNNFNCFATFGSFDVVEPDTLNVNTAVTVTGNTGDITTTVTGGTSSYDYLWDNNATTSDLDDVGAGIYSVVVTDDNGCTATTQDTVDIPVGLLNSKIENAQVALYPNPTSSFLNLDVQFTSSDNIVVEIFDLSGHLLTTDSKQDITDAHFKFDMSSYAAGVYVIKLKSSKESEVHRISIQR